MYVQRTTPLAQDSCLLLFSASASCLCNHETCAGLSNLSRIFNLVVEPSDSFQCVPPSPPFLGRSAPVPSMRHRLLAGGGSSETEAEAPEAGTVAQRRRCDLLDNTPGFLSAIEWKSCVANTTQRRNWKQLGCRMACPRHP